MEKEQLADIPIVYHEDGDILIGGIGRMQHDDAKEFLQELKAAIDEADKWNSEMQRSVGGF